MYMCVGVCICVCVYVYIFRLYAFLFCAYSHRYLLWQVSSGLGGSSACTEWKQHIASGYTWLLHVKPGVCNHFPGLCINRSQHLASGYTWLLLGSTSAAILLCVMHLWRETCIICVSRNTENNSATCGSTYLPRWICTLCLALLAAQAVTRCASRQWLRAHAALWSRHAAGRRLHIYIYIYM